MEVVVTVIVSSGAATGQQAAALGIRSLHSCQTSFSGGHNTEYSRQFLWDRAKAVNSIWNYLSCVQWSVHYAVASHYYKKLFCENSDVRGFL